MYLSVVLKTSIKKNSYETLREIIKMTNRRTLVIPSLGAGPLSVVLRARHSGKYFLLFAIIAEVLVTMTTRPQLCVVQPAEATTMGFVDKSSQRTIAGSTKYYVVVAHTLADSHLFLADSHLFLGRLVSKIK